MRLRLFDRIRRLAHFRRPPAETASGVSGAQGRHRRGRRRGPATAPGSPGFPGGPDSAGGPDPARGHAPASGEWSAPGGPPGEVAHTASPWPGSSSISEAPVPSAAPGGPAGPWADHRVSGTRRDAGAPAVRSGAARARIREAPAEAAAVGLGEAARPVPAAPGRTKRRYEAAEPGLAQSSAASLSDTRADDLARVAAGVPRQPDGPGRSSWRARRALRDCASPGTAVGRGRPQALRLDRGHPVAAMGPGVAAAPGSGGGRRPAGRTSRADQGKAGRRPRRDLHRSRRGPGTR